MDDSAEIKFVFLFVKPNHRWKMRKEVARITKRRDLGLGPDEDERPNHDDSDSEDDMRNARKRDVAARKILRGEALAKFRPRYRGARDAVEAEHRRRIRKPSILSPLDLDAARRRQKLTDDACRYLADPTNLDDAVKALSRLSLDVLRSASGAGRVYASAETSLNFDTPRLNFYFLTVVSCVQS